MSLVSAPRTAYAVGDLVLPSPAAFPPADTAPGVHRVVTVPTGRGTKYRTAPLIGTGKGVRGPADTLLAFTGTTEQAYAYRDERPSFAHPNPMGTTAEQDARARWLPSKAQVAAAVAELRTKADPDQWLAAVPLVMPGKQYGIWTVGQQVEHVAGVWVGINSFDQEPSYATARNRAADAARVVLGDRPGTVAWVTIRPNGDAAVFEDFGNTVD